MLCIASVPGAKETDFRVDEELNRLIVEESEIAEEEAELERRKEQRHKDTNPDSTPGLATTFFLFPFYENIYLH